MSGHVPLPTRRVGAVGRLLFRAPVWLYRGRLGWLLGGRLLMITHRGRKSGLARRTVLEVVAHRPEVPEWIVFSGYGSTSDWYRNLQAAPPLCVDVGRRHFAAERRFLDIDERHAVLTAYARDHATAARVLGRRLLGADFALGSDGIDNLARALPAVALRPTSGS